MEAAGQLGVGIFGSGPLQEAALLQQPALEVTLSALNFSDKDTDWSRIVIDAPVLCLTFSSLCVY